MGKRNGEIVTLADFKGKMHFDAEKHKSSSKIRWDPQNWTAVEVEQTRTYGVKTHAFYNATIPSMVGILWAPMTIKYKSKNKVFDDQGIIYGDTKEILFSSSSKSKKEKQKKEGLFHIDLENEHLMEYCRSIIPVSKFKNEEYIPARLHRKNTYQIDEITQRKYPKTGVVSEAFSFGRKKQKKQVYEYEVQVVFIAPFITEEIQPNVGGKTKLMDISLPYDADFWESQQVLKLTKEQQEFIDRIRERDNFGYKKNEIISNE